MKILILLLILMISIQPLQATYCDMHGIQGTSHDQHGDMQNHAGMNTDMDGGMDCCDHDPSDTSDNCDSMSHCGAASAGAVTIDISPVKVAFATISHQQPANSSRPLSRFYSPPLRPPIA